MQPTSPVEDISTPSTGSVPWRREKLNWAALTPTHSRSREDWEGFATFASRMAFVASSIMFTRATLEQKGKDREARRLHSMTETLLSLAMNWMLKGPVIRRAAA